MHKQGFFVASSFLVLFVLSLLTPVAAQSPYLVKNINPGSRSTPFNLTDVNGTLFFAADDGTHAFELWKSDGSATGTVMVKDICPGSCSSIPPVPTGLTYPNVNGTIFFAATDGANGVELWKSDGTAEGTVMVKDICPGSCASTPSNLTNVNGTLFFTANDGVNGIELWKSDGTAVGTVLVKDIFIGTSSSSPANLTNVNGTLFFTANDGINGVELWKSDGSVDGAVLVKDIFVGSSSSSSAKLTNVNGTLFFTATDGTTGVALWKSDGTADGTVMVKDICAGTCPSAPSNLINVNGSLFFSASRTVDLSTPNELWRSDGTAAGTVVVKVISYGGVTPGQVDLNEFTAMNGNLFFSSLVAGHGYYSYLWKSDGTPSGTVKLDTVYTDYNAPINWLTSAGNYLYFVHPDGALWKTDGTTNGTAQVSYAMDFYPGFLTVSGSRLFFGAEGFGDVELYALDLATITLDKSSLTFPATDVGYATSSQVVTVTNTSSSAITITPTIAGSFRITTNGCTAPVAAHGSCLLFVNYRATAVGTQTGTLTVTPSVGSPATVSLSGTGNSGNITVNTTALTFAPTDVGYATSSQVVTVVNKTGAPISIASSTTASFVISANSCTGIIPPNNGCYVFVRYYATAVGTQTGTLTITPSAGLPATVSLSGTGNSGNVTVNTAALTFAPTTVGQATSSQVVTVANKTGSPISIASSITASFIISANSCTGIIPPNNGCYVFVRYYATAVGTQTGTLTITPSAGAPAAVSLTGTGQ